MRSRIASISLAALGLACGDSAIECRTGRTQVDGVCVNERVADYVACVRAQGAHLDEERRKKLDVEASYAGARASVVSDARDSLAKKYSASDDAVMEIVRQCSTMIGRGRRRGVDRPAEAAVDDAPPPARRTSSGRRVGDRVDVRWNGTCYAARILQADGRGYLITYEGYARSWDETIQEDRFCR
jgi:hypothetical protein